MEIEIDRVEYVTNCGYWKWQDKQLPLRAVTVTVILELKSKLDNMKVERNKLKKIVDGMDVGKRYNMRNIVNEMEAISVERDNLKKKLEEMDFVNLQEAFEINILEEKVEEMEFVSAQWAGRVVILEKKIKS
ncbi:hypothetical protein RND71_006089 [Anisodus tanguticus]|uniref:Uncharacterized protein n=1 Tax=Anisodus tanguticus TaxID=243964 RepID=A0AAE1VNA6_9SOLA|nr:hypothetical protein RND71_006089 [Anisodus tanguticus]